jgi:hypothetical protein
MGLFNGQIHIGEKTLVVEEKESHGITEDLINAGFEGRMKTGTSKRWTFFGLFENERRKGDAKRISFLILI